MSSTTTYSLRPVGFVRSQLTAREDAPKQGSEGAPQAWVEIDPAFAEALDGIATGSEVILLTWLHEGERDTLRAPPRRSTKAAEGSVRHPLTRPSESYWPPSRLGFGYR